MTQRTPHVWARGSVTRQDVLALTDAINDGTFEAQSRYLATGDDQVELRAPSDSIRFTTNPARPGTVSVTSGGSVAAHAFVLTSATK